MIEKESNSLCDLILTFPFRWKKANGWQFRHSENGLEKKTKITSPLMNYEHGTQFTLTDLNPNVLLMFRNSCGEQVAPPVIAISVVVIGKFNSFCFAMRSMCIVGVPLTIVHLRITNFLINKN